MWFSAHSIFVAKWFRWMNWLIWTSYFHQNNPNLNCPLIFTNRLRRKNRQIFFEYFYARIVTSLKSPLILFPPRFAREFFSVLAITKKNRPAIVLLCEMKTIRVCLDDDVDDGSINLDSSQLFFRVMCHKCRHYIFEWNECWRTSFFV